MGPGEFDFDLPEGLIAQEPLARRDESQLLVLGRHTGEIAHTSFAHIGDYLQAGDVLVLNATRVFPARLIGRREPTGGAVECLLLNRVSPDRAGMTGDAAESDGVAAVAGWAQTWTALMHPGQKLKSGTRVVFEGQGVRMHGQVLARHYYGRRTIRLWSDGPEDVLTAIERIGHVPLPPYIKREDRPSDRERYQTVYARERGSVAAPTAGLHFTPELLAAIEARGVERTEITLHVGYGTFKPVRAARVEDHQVDPERFSVSESAADALTRARHDGRRIIAVGTTTTRALESLEVRADGTVMPAQGETSLFIRPGHEFRLVSALVTNLHLPRSSLLMLVAAFAGREHVLAAYREAVARRYRFYSYGDAMLIV